MRAPIDDDVGVVVQAAELGRLLRPGQRGPDAVDLVGGDLLAVARATDHDPETARIGDDGLGRARRQNGG